MTGDSSLLSNTFVLLSLTFGTYFGAQRLQRRFRSALLNPILITIAVIILFLQATGVTYETYREAGSWIDFWLKPAVVALGVPLYKLLSAIRRQLVPILCSQVIGCLIGIVSTVVTAKWLGASDAVVASLASKSVTTPIAMEVTASIGGIPSLTAAVVVVTGLIGAVAGFRILDASRIHNPAALGLSMGAAAHALGTSAAMERDTAIGAYASLGLTLNGLLTALLTPTVIGLVDRLTA